MVKIDAELPKLFPNKTGYPVFWTTLYIIIVSQIEFSELD